MSAKDHAMDFLDILRQEFGDVPSAAEFVRIVLRLLAAVLLGGLVGLEREAAGKAAGLRTHMLVALGSALTLVVAGRMGMPESDQSRVIQGIVTGIGFLGGGAILKITDQRRIRGLTTAAGIWMTAAIGIAAGTGKLTTAAVATGLTFIVLNLLHLLEQRIFPEPSEDA
jgi:putative Mg2+ transporter-C (MgtC) family protein